MVSRSEKVFSSPAKMKIILALFCAFAVASAAELYERRILGNHLEDLVTETLEYVRSLMKKHDPYTLPSMPDQHLTDKDLDLVFSASNVEVSKSSDFTIDTIKVDPLKLNSHFQVTLPTINAQGNYKISGTGFGKKLEGSGTFSVAITNYVQSGDVQLNVVDHSLQVQDVAVDNSFAKFKINVEGLNIEGLSQEEVDNLLNEEFVKYIKENKAFVAEHVAAHIKEIANALLNGHSLAEVIAFLEKLVASTPDPPPFTFAP